MHNWIEQIENTTHNFVEIFSELTGEQLNWKPDSKTWSIAQNIDHIINFNKSYFPIIESIRNETYKTPLLAKSGFIVSFLGNSLLKAVKPERKKKMKTFPIWEPVKNEYPIEILNEFKDHQSKLKDFIENSSDLVEKGTVISSPANVYIVYKLETAFDIIIEHEKRHLNQSKIVFELMKNKTYQI